MHKNVKRLIPFIILLLLIFLVYLTDLHQKFSIEWIYKQQNRLSSLAQNHPVLCPLIFIVVYIVSICLIIPDSTILTLLGGLIFPLPLAILYAIFSETVGGIIFFSVFNVFFDKSVIKQEWKLLKKMRHEFQHDSAGYLLFLRLSHFIPFWLVNLCAAYFKVRYLTFIWTCIVGVLPLVYVLANAGHSLSKLFAERKETLRLSDIFTIEIKLALFALGLLALIPIVYKKIRKKR